MEINRKLTVEIVDNGMNGEGIAKLENTTIFVPNTLQGEVVEVEIYKTKNNLAFANLVKIIKESNERRKPLCPVFGECGGCDFQHTNYENQLKLKTNVVKTTLQKSLGVINVKPCVPSPKQFGYRNKIEVPIGDNKIGFYKWNTNTIVPIKNCPLCESWFKKLLNAFDFFIKNYNISTYNKQTRKGNLRHLVARYIDDCLSIVVVITEKTFPHAKELIDLLKKDFPNLNVFQNINAKPSGAVMSSNFKFLCGKPVQTATDFGIMYEISPYSFLQVNRDMQNIIYQNILDKIEKNSVVIDAFSGAGLLTAIVSKKCKKVFGIEIVKDASGNADELLKQNNIKNAININADCGVELPKLVEKLKAQNTQNINIILDPPRKGVSKEVLKAILKCQPSKILYLSCNPATLARDLKELAHKYKIESVQPYDMFPQTKHIETLVCLERKEN
ncbi:MAG: 23S rRNA (uracil(1939)-C(5))-methyltransferase RlmD [Clostridia bacterium]|nr:23S rRNA (uracil(1939)-C(5))-methyltransferase RlmD [Clostridia bacterium]